MERIHTFKNFKIEKNENATVTSFNCSDLKLAAELDDIWNSHSGLASAFILTPWSQSVNQ